VIGSEMSAMRLAKILCGFAFLVVLASNVWSISRWNESRGVYDDVCYLRQAHLFQRFGASGLDTNTVFDDDHYLASKLKEIGFPNWNDAKSAPCHTLIPVKDKYVLQYPPGTGFVLSLFPAGFQVIPLYVLANVTIFGFALLGLFQARDPASLTLAAIFGIVAIYLMINPAKASYSVAPTMMACALAGFLTAKLFANGQRHRLGLTILIGLVIGLSVNFRLPNLFLSAGYCLVLLVSFLLARNKETLLQGISFALALLVGIAPTLIANAINAGSPLSTTYGGVDAVAPELNSSVLWSYLTNVQFVLLLICCAWTGLLWRSSRQGGVRQVALVVAGNLVVNLIFFMTHPLFTPYYLMPIAMLSLWTLLFATLDLRSETARDSLALRQPVKA
jgi:4-amino-4-deoxy-L-arabinose transferase-like glycosyltransferase